MTNLTGCLAKKQTIIRGTEGKASATAFINQGLVIFFGVEPEHRELETVLPLSLSVAGSSIATKTT
jgi:hypothetical protein